MDHYGNTESTADIEKLFYALTELQRKHAQADYQLQRLNTDIQNRKLEKDNLEKKIESNRRHIKEMQNDIRIFNIQLREKETELKLHQSTTSHMQMKLISAKEELNLLNQEMKDGTNSMNEECAMIEVKLRNKALENR